jgi:cytochrome c-type biogenesis protein CcmH/NrfG
MLPGAFAEEGLEDARLHPLTFPHVHVAGACTMALPMKLVIEDDDGGRREVPLDREELTIGRTADNCVHLPQRNVSRRHARLWRRESAFVLEDLKSSNGTRVNGVRITEPVELHDGDMVTIGDYGVALRPDDFAPDAPLVEPRPEDGPETRPDILVDTAPHPLTPAVETPPEPPPTPPVAARPRRRALVASAIGLLLGLGGALILLRQLDGAGTRTHATAPPPPPAPVQEAAATQAPPPPSEAEPPLIELTPPTVAQRPSTATEWLAAARAAADRRDFDRALKLLTPVRDRAYQADVQALRRTWRLEAAAGRALRMARHELDQGRPSIALRHLEGAKSSRVWTAEVAALRTEITAALKAPRKAKGKVSSGVDVERLYREGKVLYDAGNSSGAATRFDRCLALDPSAARCHLMLATSLARTGSATRAETHYRRFLELASADDPAVPRVKKFLEDSDAQKKARASSAIPQR